MAQLEKFVKKLYTAFKLSGFLVRREFCVYIIEKFSQEDVDLNCSDNFDIYFKRLCDTLEKQCLLNKSIEKNNIEQAVEVCLHSGRDKSETIFNVIDAFDFPRLQYNPDRKMYFFSTSQSRLLSDANSKTQLFWDRYTTILQRTLRNFRNLQLDNEKDRPSLQTVDYLLTSNNITLHTTLVLGSLLQVSEGKYYLEDPTGIVQLDLSHAKYRGRFFLENTFVLVNGYYEDKILLVSTVVVPPGEKYADSKVVFNNINYFGGPSSTLLRDSKNLKDQLVKHALDTMFFFSDVWLDHPMMFEKLEILFEGLQNSPPIAFVFMGNFMEELNGLDKMNVLKKLFKQFGELLGQFPNLVNNSNFVFVPSMSDPSTPHLVPRLGLPKYITEDFRRYVPKAIFATNPCRIQYCNREIVLFRADLLVKLTQGTIYTPSKEENDEVDIADCIARTIIGQGHLSPLPLNALTVHWDFDYTLRLYPLPDLIVLGDKSEPYESTYKDCTVVNPVSIY